MNVPQLRFDGFNEEWEVKKLSDVAITKGGFAFPSQRFKNEKSNYQVIKMGNLYNNKLDLDRSPSYLESISNRDQEYLLNEGDIIITLTGTVHKTDFGYSHMITNEKNLLVNQRLALVKSKANSDSFFLLNLIRHKRFLQQFFTSSIGGTGNQANVSTKAMEGFSIVTPSLLEQKKISNFFTLLNNRISKQQEKIEKLEQFKKGMMQKIFSQELRFKDEDGGEFPEWVEKKLGEMAEVVMGQSPKGENYSTDNQNTVLIQGNADMKSGKVVPRIYTSEVTKACLPGDIIMSVRAPVGEIALTDKTACIGRGVCAIRGNMFVYHFLSYFNLIKAWNSLSQGSTFESVNGDDIKTLTIPAPSIKEQEKIAEYLTKLEKKVEKEKEKLMVLEEQKRGFMQGMFV
ncbi:restriction endonuclease subunit S [Planomicrobium chinense]|uniref:restriction endonuclease subunit S n=1 Tax=Planococcus chinensis TaxID=272917 RepID=UPI001CC5AA89|nr:restriction endonuclease subunit S [Planococcus chinensis]MBZ5201563.1 restriction endonuclease subunit S [Planococcus chinensis]